MEKKKLDWGVVIGRFQILHIGHEYLISRSLAISKNVIVVLGSGFKARDTRNPFTWQERKEMIEGAFPDDRGRIHFVVVRDYYADEEWAQAVVEAVSGIATEGVVGLVGHHKDMETSSYLNMFPSWEQVQVKLELSINATDLRKKLFESQTKEEGLAGIQSRIGCSVHAWLEQFIRSATYEKVRHDSFLIDAYRKKWNAPFYLTADAVVVCDDHILLIERGGEIGKGLWAVPGGFMDAGETFFSAALRELKEETQMSIPDSELKARMRAQKVFDAPRRSERGRIITQAFFFDLSGLGPIPIKAGDDASKAQWIPLSQLNEYEECMFEDHACILRNFGFK